MTTPTVQNFFEQKAKTGEWRGLYDLNNPSSYPFVIRLKKTIQMLDKIDGKNVCDLGCGTGALIPFVTQSNAQYTGIDFSEEMLSKIRNNENISSSKIKLYGGVPPVMVASKEPVVPPHALMAITSSAGSVTVRGAEVSAHPLRSTVRK